MLHRLDGIERFSFILWRLPEGRPLDQTSPETEATEYMQSAGSFREMTVEVRRIGESGPEHLVVGRPRNWVDDPDEPVTITWSEHEVVVARHEVFTADAATPLFAAYYKTGSVLPPYSLRPLRDNEVGSQG